MRRCQREDKLRTAEHRTPVPGHRLQRVREEAQLVPLDPDVEENEPSGGRQRQFSRPSAETAIGIGRNARVVVEVPDAWRRLNLWVLPDVAKVQFWCVPGG